MDRDSLSGRPSKNLILRIKNFKDYKRKLWKKSFFIITFFVSKFIGKIKSEIKRYNSLKKIHFKTINDLSHYVLENTILEQEKKLEYSNITSISQTNVYRIIFLKAIFCIYIVN